MTKINCDIWRFKMVEVEVFTLLGNSAHLKLHGIIDFNLHQDKYKDIVLAQRTSEGAESYYLHYYALRCEISEAAAEELIALGVKVENLEDLKNFRV
jgi:EAL domain-containing protein (putative c-di-GMP-specific phosphodiesterase class I)